MFLCECDWNSIGIFGKILIFGCGCWVCVVCIVIVYFCKILCSVVLNVR